MTGSTDPRDLATIDEVIALAREVIDPGAYTWAASGAGQGVTAARNAVALNSLALVPRVLRTTEPVDPTSSFVGVPLGIPVFLAPVAALGLYDPGDALTASIAATEMSTPVMVSALTGSTWEEVAATAPGCHLFQVYVFGDRTWMAEVLSRVEEAGYAGICVTVDTPVIGRRDRSLEERYVWSYPAGGPPNLLRHGWDTSHRSRYTWADLEWLCTQTELPVIVKGVMTAEDAITAVDCGVAGVYVSNHGGRQVDHSVSTIEVLAEVVEAVAANADVAVDGGFTRGAEVCKALALGARAVGIGRLQCWSLAVGGSAGLARVLEILSEEIVGTMANIGCQNVDEITPDRVRWSFPASPAAAGPFSPRPGG